MAEKLLNALPNFFKALVAPFHRRPLGHARNFLNGAASKKCEEVAILVLRPTGINDLLLEQVPELLLNGILQQLIQFLLVDEESKFLKQSGIQAVLKIADELDGLCEVPLEQDLLEEGHFRRVFV